MRLRFAPGAVAGAVPFAPTDEGSVVLDADAEGGFKGDDGTVAAGVLDVELALPPPLTVPTLPTPPPSSAEAGFLTSSYPGGQFLSSSKP